MYSYHNYMRNTTLYNIGGTTSFRLSSHKILDRWGTNLQNIEKSLRRIYIPDPDKIFVQVDQSGAEALIVAYLCIAGNFRELFTCGIKPHVFVALHLFKDTWQTLINEGTLDIKCDINEVCNLPINKLKSHPFWKDIDRLIKASDGWPARKRYYYIAKQVCHSSNYGVGPQMFALNTLEKSKGKIVISKKDAEKYLTFYHALFPEIRLWHSQVKEQLDKTSYLYNLFGFPRYFHKNGKFDEIMFKEAYAFIPQSTVATITNVVITDLQNFIEVSNLDWDILANTHDSLLVQCPIKDAQDCAEVIVDLLGKEMTAPDGVKFSMKSEAVSGFNWSPANGTNLEGLKELTLLKNVKL